MSSYKTFRENIKPQLKSDLNLKNINIVPKVDKVIVALGIGSLATRKGVKDFSEFEANLAKITGQKPQLIKSKKAISNFKLRENMPVMLRVTLRRDKAYDFLDRLVKLVLPRVRDFAGISGKSFDNQWNYSLWLQSYHLFPELGLEDVVTPMWVQISVAFSGGNKVNNQALLKKLWFIFIEK